MWTKDMETTVHKFRWTNDSSVFHSHVKIYDKDNCIGDIPDTRLEKHPAVINGKKFIVDNHKDFFLPKTYTLKDFDHDKKLCQIIEDSGHKVFAIIDNVKYDIGLRENDNPSQNNGLITQMYNDKMFFYKSGTLEIRSDKNLEILIVCSFFARRLTSDQDA
jgi:hypothetical protein